jgi:hypothetical protein
MNPNRAEENLQTIRTLMERSALYRRALAPIMLLAGIIGVLASAASLFAQIESPKVFAAFWFAVAIVVIALALLLARRQALKDHESFWSPPTKRVAQALMPPLLSGMFLSSGLTFGGADGSADFPMVVLWLFFYGCALHSAGFFMTSGIRLFGWIFITGAIVLLILQLIIKASARPDFAGIIMGGFFGSLHLAYGIYLYFTEKKSSAA